MNLRALGAVVVIAGCGGFGFSMAAEQIRRIRFLSGLLAALQFMELELQFHLTALPELCAMAGKQSGGTVKAVLTGLSRELNQQLLPDVSSCMQQVLSGRKDLSSWEKAQLRQLGNTLGRFDLPGQLEGIRSLSGQCRQKREALETGGRQRLRNYEILGLCAGAALVILFI